MRRILAILIAAAVLSSGGHAQTHYVPGCPAEIGHHRAWEFAHVTRYWYACRFGKQSNVAIDDKAYMVCLYVQPLNLCLTVERRYPPTRR